MIYPGPISLTPKALRTFQSKPCDGFWRTLAGGFLGLLPFPMGSFGQALYFLWTHHPTRNFDVSNHFNARLGNIGNPAEFLRFAQNSMRPAARNVNVQSHPPLSPFRVQCNGKWGLLADTRHRPFLGTGEVGNKDSFDSGSFSGAGRRGPLDQWSPP